MASFPRIEIRQQYAKLGFDADLGQQSIRQPRATFELTTTSPKLNMQSPRGELDIDQSKAWDALGKGDALQFMSRIYARAQSLGLEGIGRIAEKGNRLAAIHLGGNPIADMAREEAFRTFPFQYYGPASYDNVDISYRANKLSIELEQGAVNLHAQMNPPEMDYIRGKLKFYMIQHGNVKITPPQIDLKA